MHSYDLRIAQQDPLPPSATAAPEAAAGWLAVEQALHTLYGDQQPEHFGSLIRYRLGGEDPLDGISVYRSDRGQPHWHYVSYGFSDLYGDLEDSLDVFAGKPSGYGFELTFRLLREEGQEQPPRWPLDFLQNLARYVFRTGNVLMPGHWMSANGPIEAGSDSLLTEIAVVQDPELPAMHTEFGDVMFLQLVALTADELRQARRWNVQGALQALQPYLPLWITNVARPSLHALSDVRAAIDAGAGREGSKTGVLYSAVLALEPRKRLLRSPQTVVRLGSLATRDLQAMLPARLAHGRSLILAGEGARLEFVAADHGPDSSSATAPPLTWQGEQALQLQLNPTQMQLLLQTLKAQEGEYTVPGLEELVWQIKPSVMSTSSGLYAESFVGDSAAARGKL